MTQDELYMARCLQLATMAEGNTSPNPMVGAVIVHNNKIIGEGYHHKAGQPHAEPNAIANVKNQSLLQDSTMYVSLEPCSHWGKTPPCAELIIQKKIKRVVVATLDPNPKVAGRGISMMRKSGIEVVVGVLEKEARYLNRRFITFQEKKRPYVILKWAETADCYIDALRTEKGNGPIRISNSITKTLNHQVRTEEDAIMVATKTALLDDPHLTVTKWTGNNPIRVVLDRCARIPKNARIFDNEAKTIIFTTAKSIEKCDYKNNPNVELIPIIFNDQIVSQILNQLAQRNILSIIIEGGSQWLQTVINSGLWDEARIEKGPHSNKLNIKQENLGIKAPKLNI